MAERKDDQKHLSDPGALARTGDNTGIGSARSASIAGDAVPEGGKSAARRAAQQAAGTGTPGHGGTGTEDSSATPGRVSAGSTGGNGFVGGSAMGDEGLGDT